jgi:hypothetical protein
MGELSPARSSTHRDQHLRTLVVCCGNSSHRAAGKDGPKQQSTTFCYGRHLWNEEFAYYSVNRFGKQASIVIGIQLCVVWQEPSTPRVAEELRGAWQGQFTRFAMIQGCTVRNFRNSAQIS